MKFADFMEELSAAVPTPEMTEFKKLVGGGYNIKVLRCNEDVNKEYYEIVYDIAEGEFKGMFSDDYFSDESKDFRHHFYVSYKNKNFSNIKRLIEVVEQSNPGLGWTGDPKELEGALLGVVLREEEYERNDGEIGIRISSLATLKSTIEIDSGNFTVQKIKKLPVKNAAQQAAQHEPVCVGAGQGKSVFGQTKVDDSDVPF